MERRHGAKLTSLHGDTGAHMTFLGQASGYPTLPPLPSLATGILGRDASLEKAQRTGGRASGEPDLQLAGSAALVSHFLCKPQFPRLYSGANTYLARFLGELNEVMYKQEHHKK